MHTEEKKMQPFAPLFDLHCHILPGMDDGARSVEEALELLKQSAEQGVRAMVLTSHYYPKETVSRFLERRKEACRILKEALKEVHFRVPDLTVGAEVAWFSGITHVEEIEKLCIYRTRYMLLELPFQAWSEEVFHDLEVLTSVLGIKVIIAHLERYLNLEDKKTIECLLDSKVLIQMNGEFILNPRTSHTAKKLFKKGFVDLLGSDCHRMDTRPQTLGPAAAQLQKWKMTEQLEDIVENVVRMGIFRTPRTE